MPPSIKALAASLARLEVDGELQLAAVVEDDETTPEDLIYEWSAEWMARPTDPKGFAPAAIAGVFTGTGPRVRWRAPKGERTPATYQLTLTVIERYTVPNPDGTTATKENRASAATGVDVNDSPRDVANLVLAFLEDFSNSNVSAESCVRHFSNTCKKGKAEELEDIRQNRERYTILSSRYRVDNVTVNSTFDFAEIKAPCEFTSRETRTGRTEVARGDCNFTAVYGQRRWWLCESHFDGATRSGLIFLR